MSAARGTSVARVAGEDRRFRRTQVRPVRRRGRGRGVPWTLLRRLGVSLTGLGLAWLAARYVVASPSFHVQRIVVQGNHRLSVGEVLALLDGLQGQHLFEVRLAAWRERLLGSPWVADARLRRVLPGAIEIALIERAPLAMARSGGRLFLVDERGAAIDEYGPQYADIDLPIIDGLSSGDSADPAGPPASFRQPRAELAARVLASLSTRAALLQRVSQIDVRDPRNAVVILKGDGTRLHLGDTAFADRLASYVELAPALVARVQEIDYVDLRFGPRIFVRPAAGTGKPAERTPARLAP